MQHPGSSPRSKFLEYKTFVQDDASFSRRYFVPPNPALAGNGVPISLRHHTDNVTAVRWVGENSCLTCGIDSSLCKWDLSEVLRQSSAGDAGSANEDRTDHRADKEPSIFKPKVRSLFQSRRCNDTGPETGLGEENGCKTRYAGAHLGFAGTGESAETVLSFYGESCSDDHCG